MFLCQRMTLLPSRSSRDLGITNLSIWSSNIRLRLPVLQKPDDQITSANLPSILPTRSLSTILPLTRNSCMVILPNLCKNPRESFLRPHPPQPQPLAQNRLLDVPSFLVLHRHRHPVALPRSSPFHYHHPPGPLGPTKPSAAGMRRGGNAIGRSLCRTMKRCLGLRSRI
jgi:hypothetical protein